MGVLVNSESILMLRKARFPEAMAALKALAEELDCEFHDSDSIVEAEEELELIETLEMEYWQAKLDDDGNIVKLEYTCDKAPRNALDSWPEAMFETLAPFIEYGKVEVAIEDYTFGLAIEGGRVRRCPVS